MYTELSHFDMYAMVNCMKLHVATQKYLSV